MNKAELALLERAFTAEINAALSKNDVLRLIQTRSRVAKKLVENGMLRETTIFSGHVSVTGYELTHLGRFTYCATA